MVNKTATIVWLKAENESFLTSSGGIGNFFPEKMAFKLRTKMNMT